MTRRPGDEDCAAEKSECWYILDAEPGAVIGLGLSRQLPADESRASALDGSFEQLVNWKPVKAGDFILVSQWSLAGDRHYRPVIASAIEPRGPASAPSSGARI